MPRKVCRPSCSAGHRCSAAGESGAIGGTGEVGVHHQAQPERRTELTKVMEGIRVLEVAQFTFVPAAGAILADWGADVIKVEHAETGDAQRGLSALMGMPVGSGSFAPLMEHPNRGKRSIGLALAHPDE